MIIKYTFNKQIQISYCRTFKTHVMVLGEAEGRIAPLLYIFQGGFKGSLVITIY